MKYWISTKTRYLINAYSEKYSQSSFVFSWYRPSIGEMAVSMLALFIVWKRFRKSSFSNPYIRIVLEKKQFPENAPFFSFWQSAELRIIDEARKRKRKKPFPRCFCCFSLPVPRVIFTIREKEGKMLMKDRDKYVRYHKICRYAKQPFVVQLTLIQPLWRERTQRRKRDGTDISYIFKWRLS